MSYSYLSDAVKQAANNEFNNLHATFARPITIWKTAEQIIISTNPENSTIFAGAPDNNETIVVQQSGTFMARVLYGKKQEPSMFNSAQWRNSAEQNNLWLQEGECRIRLDPTGAAFLEGAKNVTLDGFVCEVVPNKRPHGLFTPNFYDYLVRKEN